MHAIHAVFRALAFLSRLRVPARAFAAERRLGEDAWAFPLAGFLVAAPSALLLLGAGRVGLSIPTSAILALALLVFLTGALHEDGLADVADGLGGHHAKDRALLIMKDSRIGTYGAATLVFALLLRVSLLADLVALDRGLAALALLVAAGGSRGAMVWLWSSLPTADPGGLADRVGRPSRRTGTVAALLGAGALSLPMLPTGGPAAALLPLLLAAGVLALFRAFLKRRLGGQTGDCLGAAQQLAEIAILLGLALALRSG